MSRLQTSIALMVSGTSPCTSPGQGLNDRGLADAGFTDQDQELFFVRRDRTCDALHLDAAADDGVSLFSRAACVRVATKLLRIAEFERSGPPEPLARAHRPHGLVVAALVTLASG